VRSEISQNLLESIPPARILHLPINLFCYLLELLARFRAPIGALNNSRHAVVASSRKPRHNYINPSLTQEIPSLKPQSQRPPVFVRETQEKDTTKSEIKGEDGVDLILLAVVEMTDHVLLRLVVVYNH
jgi:hypothetical protein